MNSVSKLGSLIGFAIAGVAASALTGCDPYSPDLGPTPFKCGSGDPVCPDGYTCNVAADVCEATGTGATIDAPAFQCSVDRTEPNNMPAQPYITPIPGSGPNYGLTGLSICPATDKDLFRFTVSQAGINLEASIVGMADRAPLSVDLLNSSGVVIATGAPVAGATQQVHLEVINRLAIGDYFVRVGSADATENNYNAEIKTCATVPPCP
jgi:hypothetical protein